MKLLRLELSRYGHLTDLALDFPEAAALHVLLGPNEAGKSTALAALADALFGFGHRTDFDFLHGGPNLRIGFTLRTADGRHGAFWRRKGRKDTLRDGDDRVLGEDALRPFLGGVSRPTFEQAFGLNGERLREGAKELLRSGGEAGESILAGMGLMHLRTVAEKLNEEAKSLVGDERGVRRLSAAADAWRKAAQAMQAASVRPAAWAELSTEHERLTTELVEVQAKTRALSAERSRLERVRQVRPLIGQLDAEREALACVADAPRLPADAEERRRRWSEQQRDARRDREHESESLRALIEERDKVAVDPAILELEAEIDTLVARRSVVIQAEHDLPGVREQVAQHIATVREAGHELGSQDPPERLREALPGEAARRAVQKTIDARLKATARIGPAAEARDRARRDRDKTAQSLADAPAVPPAAHLRKAVEDTRAEGKLEAELDAAGRELEIAVRVACDALAALPMWDKDATALAATPVPLEADARSVGDALIRVRDALNSARRDADSATRTVVALEHEIAELVVGGTVPTREAVAEARADRDEVWRTIRRGIDMASRESGAGLPQLSPGSIANSYEVLRDKADRLADQRADDAQRVADYELKTAHLSVLRREQEAADASASAAEAELVEAEEAWRALWAPCGLEPKAPDVMIEWRRKRGEVLDHVSAEAKARAKRDGLAARRDKSVAVLRELFPSLPTDRTLSATLVLADAACREAEDAIAARTTLAERLVAEERRLEEAETALRTTQADLQRTDPAWAQALSTLGLSADVSIDAAQAAQAAWARIGETARLWQTNERRVLDMEAEIGEFGQEVRGLLTRVGEVPGDVPPVRLLDGAARRLSAARQARDDVARLTERIRTHSDAVEAAGRRLQEAARELSELRIWPAPMMTWRWNKRSRRRNAAPPWRRRSHSSNA